MRLYTLDNIVRSALLRKGYPIHFYMQFLKYGADCLRELNFDSLNNVRSIKLELNEYNAIPLPCDYVDWIKVAVENGQMVRPYAQQDGYNRLNNFDEDGNKALYATPSNVNETPLPIYEEAVNMNGESMGRQFGFKGGNNPYGFKVLRERNGGEIQFDITATGSIILDYISDGMESDAATEIHPYAQATIEAYIFWQLKEHNRSYSPSERQLAKEQYDKEHRILRARLFSFSMTDLRRILQQNYGGAVKP